MASWQCANQSPAQQMVLLNIIHLIRLSTGYQKPHTTGRLRCRMLVLSQCHCFWHDPYIWERYRPYSHWSHSTAMARRSSSVIKAAICLQKRLKNTKACAWLSATLRSGEKQIENVKEETEKKKKQEFRWGCVLETFKTYPAGAFRQRLMEYVSFWTGLTNKVMISFPYTARGLDGYFHYTFFRSQQSLHLMPRSCERYIPIHEINSKSQWHATYQSLVTYDVLPHSPVDICKKQIRHPNVIRPTYI